MIRLQRLIRFEFWPFWFFYIPAYINWGILACKARYMTYFTATNPLMNNSGALNSSKYHYLSKLPKHWYPKTAIVKKSISVESLRSILASNTLSFPLILKPDNGERGKEVKLVHTLEQLFQALEQSHYPNLLLQSFCSYTKEAAFLYVRKPNEKNGRITSITVKTFCHLMGDGIRTWKAILKEEIRIAHRWKDIAIRESLPWDDISIKGQKYFIEPIGSHNLGTEFNNARELNSSKLLALLDYWADQLPGFYYGRFDVKYQNWEELLQGKSFALMEINGVNAEPTHIYSPNYSIFQAYRDIFSHMKIIYEISDQNRRLGIQPKRLKPFLIELIRTALR